MPIRVASADGREMPGQSRTGNAIDGVSERFHGVDVSMRPMRRNWDIFCRVIDNFGDIGVCWRLARQLAAEYGLTVRLWVDDLSALAPLCPAVSSAQNDQTVEGVRVCRWVNDWQVTDCADVVIEAFACELPVAYRQAMAQRSSPPIWINLEYLSAEDWVEGCHAIASPQPPLVKHFFFPGFTDKTGGLLRERDLVVERERFQATLPAHEELLVSLFCYDTAPIAELLTAWQAEGRKIRCLVPPGKPLTAVSQVLDGHGPWHMGTLSIEPIPFLSQSDYDRLLWSCDLNFVRGEDSFVRAQWANRPFVWQIYPQQDDAHLVKLESFLDRYTKGLAGSVRPFFLAWNTGRDVGKAWPAFAAELEAMQWHQQQWSEHLQNQGDLAAKLVNFCDQRL